MADSNITKRALAKALQDLMEELPFEKISVAQICEKCDMNRKSFYYHFKDKYDLVNWIFDTQFRTIMSTCMLNPNQQDHFEVFKEICSLLYENKAFYSKALKIVGQNSFAEHLREKCMPLIRIRLVELLGNDAVDDFNINFFADVVMCSIERWILDKECIPAGEFVNKMKFMILGGAEAIHRESKKKSI